MKVVDKSVWDTFWPLREMVHSKVEAGEDCQEELLNKWKELRNHIVATFYYLVQNVAERLHKKIREVEEDALASMGVDGLYDAVDNYGSKTADGIWDGIDPKTGKRVKFETYAVYRIRGSILDAIRREDWVPRLVRSRANKLKDKRSELEAVLGRTPTNEEMSKEMDMPVEDYISMMESSNVTGVQSLNTTFSSNDMESMATDEMSMMDCLRDPSTLEPLELMIQKETTSKLFGKNFTKLERRIIYAYYYEGRCMKEIAEVVGLSESRISQMMSAIGDRLREQITRNPEYFGSMAKFLETPRRKKLKSRIVSKPIPAISES